jgi:flagellar biosynthesis/type III secretory pathway chaperone
MADLVLTSVPLTDAEKTTKRARTTFAQRLADELEDILKMEFESLQKQDLARFEQVQSRKTDLLAELAGLCPPSETLQTDPDWQGLRVAMTQCRDMHRRNAMLIERKLEAIRGTLQSLQACVTTSNVEVYDRLGRVSRFTRGRGYQEA